MTGLKMSSPFDGILSCVNRYYSDKVNAEGPTARGVDWNSQEGQILRFEQLLKVCDTTHAFSIIDFGCGYGALFDYLQSQRVAVEYYGYDISEAMISQARKLHDRMSHCEFFTDPAHLQTRDYTVLSGIFNVKFQFADSKWKKYMLDTVNQIAATSEKGFAFNALTLYSNPEKRRADLYYADPLFWFDYCKKKFSNRVALLHDYPLYEFTLLIRKP